MQDRKTCGRQVHRDRRCIFHVENKSDEDAKVFEKEFWKELKRTKEDGNIKVLDFSRFIFPKLISFRGLIFNRPVYFFKAKFNGKADFSYCEFKNEVNFLMAEFENEVYFTHSKFLDVANFTEIKFKNFAGISAEFQDSEEFFQEEFPASFSYAEFKNKTSFSGTHFENEARFNGVEFENGTNFFETIFEKGVSFHGSKFKKKDGAEFWEDISFSKTKFKNEADFSNSVFENKARFYETEFKNKVDFSNVEFKNETYFVATKFESSAKFLWAKFLGKVYFRDTEFPIGDKHLINFRYIHKPKDVMFQNVNLSNVSFLYTDIAEVEFLDETWAKSGNRLLVVDENLIETDKMVTYDAIAQLYRRLRRNYETNYRFAEAGDFFVGEMEMRRLDVNTGFEKESVRKIVLWFKRNFSLLSIYKHISLYGESHSRLIIWSLIVIVLYPLIENLVSHWIFNTPLISYNDNLIDTYSIKSSIASFFQLENKYLGERLIGIPILGLLFIALKRKFERSR